MVTDDAALGSPDDWGPEDDGASFAEGWGIFDLVQGDGHVDANHAVLNIEKLDELDAFEDDDQAVKHVVRMALQGSPLHVKACYAVLGPNGYARGAKYLRGLLGTSGIRQLYYQFRQATGTVDAVAAMEELVT